MPVPTSETVRRRALGVAAGALLSGVLLAGCGDDKPAADPPPAAGTSTTPASPVTKAAGNVTPLAESQPKSIAISRIGVSAPVSQIGLRPDGRIEEPPLSRPNLAGWYKEGVTPGEVGPSVLLGHVDANRKPAIFARLKELKPGDTIEVTRQDGSKATFALDRLERVAKDAFPHKKVFGDKLDYSSLRLVTCGGVFDQKTGHYKDNVIAYAKLVSTA